MGEEIPKWIKCPRHTLDEDINSKMGCDRCRGSGHILNPRWVTCNMCGGDMSCGSEHEETSMYGTGPLSVSGGYLSPHLTDTTSYHFAFCERCLRTIWSQCKVKPRIDFYMGDGESTYEEDHSYWINRMWREGGGELRKLPSGLCTHDESCQGSGENIYLISGSICDRERYCSEHAIRGGGNTVWVSSEGIRPLPLDQLSRSELWTIAQRFMSSGGEALDRYDVPRGYMATFSPWAPRIVEMALGLPSMYDSDWGTRYSCLIMRVADELPGIMRGAPALPFVSISGEEMFCAVCCMSKSDMMSLIRTAGVRCSAYSANAVMGAMQDEEG